MEEAQTDRITRQFLDGTLAEEEWTHEAHLKVALWHLIRFSPEESLDRLRRGIRRYNTVCGVANTDTSGYHETITRFYVLVISDFVSVSGERGRQETIDDAATVLIRELGDKSLPLRYYSRERLMSTEARRRWVEPDLAPLDSPSSVG